MAIGNHDDGLVQVTTLDEYHDNAVEWAGDDIIFLLDRIEIYRNEGTADELSEPMFATLNFARINDGETTQYWEMEVDWVKYETRQ